MESTDPDQVEEFVWPFEHITPRDVQLAALKKGWGKRGFGYFMRQRLGKTWVAFAEFTALRKLGHVDWFVVICPNSLKGQWLADIEQADPCVPVCVYDAKYKSRTLKFFKEAKGGVFIINYDSLNNYVVDHKTKVIKYASQLGFKPDRTYVVADESTKIKDPMAKSSRAAMALGEISKYARVLTGRPTANSNADIWSQLKFIGVTERNFHAHKFTFTKVGGFQNRQFFGNINVEQLQKEIEPHCYIAADQYVKGFEKYYSPMKQVNLTGRLAEMYKAMQNDLFFSFNTDTDITAPIILVKYLRLQQISSGIAGDPNNMQHNLVDPFDNPRIRTVKEILEDEIQNKVIIVCRFRLSIKNLYDVLTKAGHSVAVLNGNMTADQIEKMKRTFNEGNSCNILIAQTSVLSYGHTLAGNDETPCDSMIFYENDFSLLNRTQCESRCEQYGRNITISYYDMYCSRMDRHIIESLIKKEDASLALMGYAREYGMRPKGIEDDPKEQQEEMAT